MPGHKSDWEGRNWRKTIIKQLVWECSPIETERVDNLACKWYNSHIYRRHEKQQSFTCLVLLFTNCHYFFPKKEKKILDKLIPNRTNRSESTVRKHAYGRSIKKLKIRVYIFMICHHQNNTTLHIIIINIWNNVVKCVHGIKS